MSQTNGKKAEQLVKESMGPTVRGAYYGSNGGATISVCKKLGRAGTEGQIAAQLFKAQKATSRAKKYKGGITRSNGEFQSYRELAYQKKDKEIEKLVDVLEGQDKINWGWGGDTRPRVPDHVLYIDLPQGQVSFHNEHCYCGREYDGKWDGTALSESRIIAFCEAKLEEK